MDCWVTVSEANKLQRSVKMKLLNQKKSGVSTETLKISFQKQNFQAFQGILKIFFQKWNFFHPFHLGVFSFLPHIWLTYPSIHPSIHRRLASLPPKPQAPAGYRRPSLAWDRGGWIFFTKGLKARCFWNCFLLVISQMLQMFSPKMLSIFVPVKWFSNNLVQ